MYQLIYWIYSGEVGGSVWFRLERGLAHCSVRVTVFNLPWILLDEYRRTHIISILISALKDTGAMITLRKKHDRDHDPR